MQYYLFWGFLHISAWLPLPLLHGISHVAGNLLNAIPNRLLAITTRHIRQCFPELTGAQQRRLVRASLVETVKTITETGILWLRPWLQQPREAIAAYAHRHRLAFVEDPSNREPRYARSRLRLGRRRRLQRLVGADVLALAAAG